MSIAEDRESTSVSNQTRHPIWRLAGTVLAIALLVLLSVLGWAYSRTGSVALVPRFLNGEELLVDPMTISLGTLRSGGNETFGVRIVNATTRKVTLDGADELLLHYVRGISDFNRARRKPGTQNESSCGAAWRNGAIDKVLYRLCWSASVRRQCAGVRRKVNRFTGPKPQTNWGLLCVCCKGGFVCRREYSARSLSCDRLQATGLRRWASCA